MSTGKGNEFRVITVIEYIKFLMTHQETESKQLGDPK